MRVGVIGAGVMGTNHARVLGGLPNITMVGIVDPLPKHRARTVEHAHRRAFETLDQLIAEGIDAVTIAAPTHLHHEIALACIARGIHVLVEKPIASSVQEGRDIVEAARRAGMTLMVGHVEREDIALLQFRTASGVLAHINTNWLTPFKARSVTVATRDKYVMGDLLTRQVTECFGFKPDGSYSMRHLPVGHDEPLRAELIAFLSAVGSGGVPAVTGDEGVASLEIAIRCLEAPAKPASAAARKGPRRVVG